MKCILAGGTITISYHRDPDRCEFIRARRVTQEITQALPISTILECYNEVRIQPVEADMASIRGWELIIILVIVLLLFGPGRLSRIAGEIGRGIREFRTGIKEESGNAEKTEEPDQTGDAES